MQHILHLEIISLFLISMALNNLKILKVICIDFNQVISSAIWNKKNIISQRKCTLKPVDILIYTKLHNKSISLQNFFLLYMVCVYGRRNAHYDWLTLEHYSPVMPTGRFNPKGLQNKNRKPRNKQLVNLERSIFTGESQTLALTC